MNASTRSGALVGTLMGVPVLASVVAAWFVVHVRGRSSRDRDELLAMEGTDLDDAATSLSADEEQDEDLDEATAVVLG